MYFPYFRGKQYEVLAVRESTFLAGSKIIPVFELTTISSSMEKRFRRVAENGVRFSIVVNSNNGQPPPSTARAVQLINELQAHRPGSVLPAFEIRPGQSISELRDFAQTFASWQCILIHRSHTFSGSNLRTALKPLSRPAIQIVLDGRAPFNVVNSLPRVGMVFLRDGFDRCVRNADYPRRSNFDDLANTYKNIGIDGFSDFSIVGDTYSASGGPAIQVAIHLTEVSSANIVTNHFVSTTSPQKGDLQAKYFSALDLLIQHTGRPPVVGFNTQGVREYHRSYGGRHFPGLGKLKQWSMMHHMELIDTQLRAMGATSFV